MEAEKIGKRGYRTGQFALTEAEYRKLLGAVKSYEDEALIRFTVATGMRREDVIGVNIADIDFKTGKVQFFEQKKSAIHTIFISPDILVLLERYIGILPKKQKKLFGFCSKTAYNRFQACLDRAGLKRRPFHALRSTCIKFCQLKGWTAQQTAAHVNDKIDTVEAHYTVPSESEMRELAQKNGFA